MKKIIFSVMAIMMMFSACKKDAVNKSATQQAKTPVTFNIGYSQSTGAFNGAANISKSKFSPHTLAVDTALTKYASVIYVGLYSSDGTLISLTKQLSTDTVFGKASYNLSPGNYIVTFAAGGTGLLDSSNGTLNGSELYYYVNGGYAPWKNTFYQKINVTVGNTGINQNVTLKRIDSQIVVVIEDAVPANVKFISFSAFDNSNIIYQSLRVSTGQPWNNGTTMVYANTSVDTALTPGTKNIKLWVPILDNTANRPIQFVLSAYDQLPKKPFTGNDFNGNVIASYGTSSLVVQQGYQTVITGKLFGGNGLTNTGGFQMTVDPQWSSTTTTIPFQ